MSDPATDPLPKSIHRVQNILDEHNLTLQLVEYPEGDLSAEEAADAIGCEPEQIAKSLVFRRMKSGKPILVIASETNRVNEKALKAVVGEKVERAEDEYAEEHTGYSVDGIPPVGLVESIETFIDEDLLTQELIWAAAGTPRAVFSLTPQALVEITGGDIISVK